MTTTQKIQTPAPAVPTKAAIIQALRAFIAQRSGIEWANYGEREAFMGDYRPMLRHGKQAREMLRAIEWRDSITTEQIMSAARSAFSGRLSFVVRADGAVGVDYCTGQYFVTEYRRAVCAVLSSVLWNYWRENMPALEIAKAPEACPQVAHGIVNAGDYIRRQARNEFGRGIAGTWFN